MLIEIGLIGAALTTPVAGFFAYKRLRREKAQGAFQSFARKTATQINQDGTAREAVQVSADIAGQTLRVIRSAMQFHHVLRGVTLGLFVLSLMSAAAKFAVVVGIPIIGVHPDIVYRLSYALFFACILRGFWKHRYAEKARTAFEKSAAEALAKLQAEHAAQIAALEAEITALRAAQQSAPPPKEGWRILRLWERG